MINRIQYEDSYEVKYEEWATKVTDILRASKFADLKIEIFSDYNYSDSILNTTILSTAINDLSEKLTLSVLITENHIFGKQKDGSEINPNYEHNHVLRGAINGTFGEEVSNEGISVGDSISFNAEEPHILLNTGKKTLKAYPYANLAADRLNVLTERLENISSKKRKKQYTKRIQKYLEEELTEQLKKLTRTEGRILIKLVHRQTGNTSFNLIKNFAVNLKDTAIQNNIEILKNYADEILESIDSFDIKKVEELLKIYPLLDSAP